MGLKMSNFPKKGVEFKYRMGVPDFFVAIRPTDIVVSNDMVWGISRLIFIAETENLLTANCRAAAYNIMENDFITRVKGNQIGVAKVIDR